MTTVLERHDPTGERALVTDGSRGIGPALIVPTLIHPASAASSLVTGSIMVFDGGHTLC